MMQVTKWRPEAAGLLTSAGMLSYMAYLLWSALTTEPAPSACVKDMGAGDNGIKASAQIQACTMQHHDGHSQVSRCPSDECWMVALLPDRHGSSPQHTYQPGTSV